MNPEPFLFIGDANQALARVYASMARAGLPPDVRLAGEVVGPQCRYAQTLPARIRFADRGPGETLLAEAIVPDPCFWTPELPFMYTAELRCESAGQAHQPIERRSFGIRRLGAHAKSIYLDAKRFVPRGVRRETAEIADLPAARNAASALYVTGPSDEFLREASEAGVLLAVDLSAGWHAHVRPAACSGEEDPAAETNLLKDLARLSRWPAVAIIVLDANVPAGSQLRSAARNTLLAQHLTESSMGCQPWAHIAWREIGPSGVVSTLPRDRPVIVYRPSSPHATIEAGRRQCDSLQADLALEGDFAGYFA